MISSFEDESREAEQGGWREFSSGSVGIVCVNPLTCIFFYEFKM